ncbi:MAG: enoyl-CoA hydratase/isomerase family protein [Deltaproteobacteria bacterium]|nr:enoyl-CoA hydratase/isomerase family protein [Deltaproteobacteria bacterium]
MADERRVLCEVSGAVATLTINRPDKLNALDGATIRELAEAADRVAVDPAIRAVIVTGAGEKSFVAGADIAEMQAMTEAEALDFSERGQRCVATFERMSKASIAAVNGFALGGGTELALACDVIYASENARFGQPEVNLGVIPGFGGSQRLALRVGWGKANELMFSGDVITAPEALRIGLCEAVFPLAELRSRAMALAEKIAKKGPLAVAAVKRVRGQGLEAEARAFATLFGTADQKEGMTAFLAKRAAVFKGS